MHAESVTLRVIYGERPAERDTKEDPATMPGSVSIETEGPEARGASPSVRAYSISLIGEKNKGD